MAHELAIERMIFGKLTQRSRSILLLAGVTGIVFGIMSFIPFLFQEKYWLASFSMLIFMLGLILAAIAFGDPDDKY